MSASAVAVAMTGNPRVRNTGGYAVKTCVGLPNMSQWRIERVERSRSTPEMVEYEDGEDGRSRCEIGLVLVSRRSTLSRLHANDETVDKFLCLAIGPMYLRSTVECDSE